MLVATFLLTACKYDALRSFDPMVGYEGDTVCMDMDLENAVLECMTPYICAAVGTTTAMHRSMSRR